ncbi:hypothetical protein [Saccharothrix variisporea]|uniref:Uncharacterized protein n=1 Tax=Saccharothrix variisporea TaxID=543527 RepID=A0A495X3D0_9PSEU|nr:hypothetical protein [Saccharothrix variisporea]RKT67103.1 hypothetical protein DFJ66_0271 [Saccharothrix variisporea]
MLRRRDALAVVGAGFTALTGGLTWLCGAYGLIGSGAALIVVGLFVDWRD